MLSPLSAPDWSIHFRVIISRRLATQGDTGETGSTSLPVPMVLVLAVLAAVPLALGAAVVLALPPKKRATLRKVLRLPVSFVVRFLLPVSGLRPEAWRPLPFAEYYPLEPPPSLDRTTVRVLDAVRAVTFFPGYVLYVALFYGLSLAVFAVFYAWCILRLAVKRTLGSEF